MGVTYDDTVAALDGGTDLRIGIHVQGFDGGGSESFINNGDDGGDDDGGGEEGGGVPEPGSLALLGAGLAAVGIRLRRRAAAIN